MREAKPKLIPNPLSLFYVPDCLRIQLVCGFKDVGPTQPAASPTRSRATDHPPHPTTARPPSASEPPRLPRSSRIARSPATAAGARAPAQWKQNKRRFLIFLIFFFFAKGSWTPVVQTGPAPYIHSRIHPRGTGSEFSPSHPTGLRIQTAPAATTLPLVPFDYSTRCLFPCLLFGT